ncbi:MAG: DUF1800 domain-containing protein [Methylococcales bacterium]|nr:DUF1800 domain-containing protein [Methylococcales bacterium]
MQKKLRLIKLGLAATLFLGGAISVGAADLDITITSGATGTVAKLPITLKQKQQYTNKKGKIRYRWERVSAQRTDSAGHIQFHFPDNIGQTHADGGQFLNVFKLISKNPSTQKKLVSPVFTNTSTQFFYELKGGTPPSNPNTSHNVSQTILHRLNRITFGVTPELITYVQQIGIDAYIEEQLYPQSIDDSDLLAKVNGWIEAKGEGEEGIFAQGKDRHLSYYTLYQAMVSKRQLQEVMTQFWENHFNTDISKTKSRVSEAKENSLFRANALGKFRDILAISAHSPMMMRYLDNATSKKQLPNENYAREIMELHTLGVSGGYTENDVVELSKILTGWGVKGRKDLVEFKFRANQHDPSDKVFLGQTIKSNGQEEGELVLDMLASSPKTASYICAKLAQVFVNDTPSNQTVKQCARTFSRTEGDMREVVRTLITSSEFKSKANFHSKVKTPLEFVVGLNRAFGFDNPEPSGLQTLEGDISGAMKNDLISMSMSLYKMPAPTGYPEVAKKWVDSAQLKARMQYQNKLLLNQRFDILAEIKSLGLHNAEEIVDYYLMLLLGNDYHPEEREMALNLLTENRQKPFDVNTMVDSDLRSDKVNLLRATLATIASFPSHQLQ